MSETITGVYYNRISPNAYGFPTFITIASTGTVGGANAPAGYDGIDLKYLGPHGQAPGVTNFGTVTGHGYGYGARVDVGLLSNEGGTITGGIDRYVHGMGYHDGNDGIYLAGGEVTNTGKISGANGPAYGYGGIGLYQTGGIFLNFAAGQVTGGTGGVANHGGTGMQITSGEAGNFGIIRGGDDGGAIEGGPYNGYVFPGGSTGGAGLIFGSGSLVTADYPSFSNYGQIIGGAGTIGGNGVVFSGGVDALPGTSFVNDGTITGGHGSSTGGEGIYAVSFATAGSITNAGTVIGGAGGITGGAGLSEKATLYVSNTGRIIGGASSGQYIYGGDGVSLGGGSVTNSGNITGGSGYYGGDGIYIGNAGTVVDSGTISVGVATSGESPDDFAVLFHSGASRLVVEHGADLIGGASADAAFTNVLEFGTGTGTLSDIGVPVDSSTGKSGITGFNSFAFDSGAAWTLSGTVAGFNNVDVSGFTKNDTFDVAGAFSATLPESVRLGANAVLTVPETGGGNLEITFSGDAGVLFTISSDGHGGIDITEQPCFAEGTRIATPEGEAAVEALAVGDLVTTLEGPRPVTWLGYRAVDLRQFKDPGSGCLVRIVKGAFAENTPRRDLLVTQEHCIYIDGGLIPARMLVNGSSIFIDKSITNYTYYHVELATHGILLAEGLAAESYLDTGNRGNFANADIVSLVPDFDAGQKGWADAAAPLTIAAAVVEPVWRRLNARAKHLGMPRVTPAPALTDDPDLHLMTGDGAVIRPVRRNGETYVFMVPKSSTALRLVSRTARPSETVGPFIDDRRALGVLVAEMTLHDGRRKINLAGADLPGWFGNGSDAQRWTNGNAELPVALDALGAPAAMLEIRIVQAGPYLLDLEMAGTEIAA
jgi:hypothetical protein